MTAVTTLIRKSKCMNSANTNVNHNNNIKK